MIKKYKLMLNDGFGTVDHIATFYTLKRLLKYMYDNTLDGYQSYGIIILSESRDVFDKNELISHIASNEDQYTSTEYNLAEDLRVET